MAAARDTLLLLAPLPTVLLGAAVADASHVPLMAFLPNVLGVLLGALGVLALRRMAPDSQERVLMGMAAVACIALLATLGAAGLEGVHRWVPLGPLRLNASAAFLPWILGGLAASSPRARALAVALTLVAQGVHVAQPDAGQATALAAGAVAMLVGGTVLQSRVSRVAVGAVLVSLAGCAWLRVDPLAPVEHVERILLLAFSLGLPWVGAALVAGSLLFAPMLLVARSPGAENAGLAVGLALYFCTAIGVTFLGNFPVPVMGAGVGPVLGWYAALAVLAARAVPLTYRRGFPGAGA